MLQLGAPALLLVLAALLTLSVSACAAGSSNRRAEHNDGWWSRTVGEGARKLLVRYRAGALEAPWTPARDFTADFSFYNSALGATIYGDTSCGKRYEDAPLTVLINHLVLGFTDVATTVEITDASGAPSYPALRGRSSSICSARSWTPSATTNCTNSPERLVSRSTL